MNIVYQGDQKTRSSPNKVREVSFQSKRRSYEILNVLEFDSTRKRMSIILRHQDSGRIVLFCKGADTAVLSKCVPPPSSSSSDYRAATENAIKMFAHSGWRTLALSYRDLSPAEYENYSRMLQAAYANILDRSKLMEQAYEEIESNLTLIGSTAIEDKLQDQVSETIEALRQAGIKVWILTGDKVETAVNISQFCGHFSDEMEKLSLVGSINEQADTKQNLDRYLEL